MRLGAIFLCCIFGLSHGQFDFPNPYSAEQCASKLACSMNYSKVFDSKISELTYHHNLDLYKLRSFFVETINPIEQDTDTEVLGGRLQTFTRLWVMTETLSTIWRTGFMISGNLSTARSPFGWMTCIAWSLSSEEFRITWPYFSRRLTN